MLQYNKLYQSLKKVSAEWHAGHIEWGFYYDYLKFYEDGVVINCNDASKENLDKWLDRYNEVAFFRKSMFKEEGNKLSFEIQAAAGVIKYEGQIQSNIILLFVENKVVGYRNVDCFELVD